MTHSRKLNNGKSETNDTLNNKNSRINKRNKQQLLEKWISRLRDDVYVGRTRITESSSKQILLN